MKKLLFSCAIVFSLLVMTTGAAFAAPHADGTVISLLEVRSDAFIFSVSGHFSQPELNSGFVSVNGDTYPLHCSYIDDNTVRCTIPNKTYGHDVMVNFGGSSYWSSTPQPKDTCYNVYDYDMAAVWGLIGIHCQEQGADVGDMIRFYNPVYNNSYDYWYQNESDCVNFGEGYYYDYCP